MHKLPSEYHKSFIVYRIYRIECSWAFSLTFVYVTALHGAECVHLVAAPSAAAIVVVAEHLGHDLRLTCTMESGQGGPKDGEVER